MPKAIPDTRALGIFACPRRDCVYRSAGSKRRTQRSGLGCCSPQSRATDTGLSLRIDECASMDIGLSVALNRACGRLGRCRLPLTRSSSGTIKGLLHYFREPIHSTALSALPIAKLTEPQNTRTRTMAMDALTSLACYHRHCYFTGSQISIVDCNMGPDIKTALHLALPRALPPSRVTDGHKILLQPSASSASCACHAIPENGSSALKGSVCPLPSLSQSEFTFFFHKEEEDSRKNPNPIAAAAARFYDVLMDPVRLSLTFALYSIR